jgi:hypothetical protein
LTITSGTRGEIMLEQKQLYLASRLFLAAGKEGFPFDLSKFSNDRDYAMQTLGELLSTTQIADTQTLVAELLISLQGDFVVKNPSASVSTNDENSTSTNSEAPTQKKYFRTLR